MVELPKVGPLAQTCSRTIDELLGVKPPTPLGRCGLLSCGYCGAHALVHEVGATARILAEEGGRPMVAALHSIPHGLAPEVAWGLVGPKLGAAVGRLREKYVGGFEARCTLEIDSYGLANVHLLETGRSTPRVGTVRKAFDAVGLGRRVEMQHEVKHPIAMASYATKIALLAFAIDPKGSSRVLDYARRLNGDRFSRATPGFYRGARSQPEIEQLGKDKVADVVQWAETYPRYWAKTPPDLVDELDAIGVPLPGDGCQKRVPGSANDLSEDFWSRVLGLPEF